MFSMKTILIMLILAVTGQKELILGVTKQVVSTKKKPFSKPVMRLKVFSSQPWLAD
jgi:hypothetical protein